MQSHWDELKDAFIFFWHVKSTHATVSMEKVIQLKRDFMVLQNNCHWLDWLILFLMPTHQLINWFLFSPYPDFAKSNIAKAIQGK